MTNTPSANDNLDPADDNVLTVSEVAKILRIQPHTFSDRKVRAAYYQKGLPRPLPHLPGWPKWSRQAVMAYINGDKANKTPGFAGARRKQMLRRRSEAIAGAGG